MIEVRPLQGSCEREESSLEHTHSAHAHLLFFVFTRQSLLLIVQ